MKVKLINYTTKPEDLVSIAAKLCYSENKIETIIEKTNKEESEKFVNKLLEYGHESPIEHVSFTFAIEGVSRSLLAQITRHRIASFSVKSQRYVKETNFSFIIPPKIEKNKKAKEIYINFMKESQNCYLKILKLLNEQNKKELIEKGFEEEIVEKKVEKISAEDARFVLTNACATQFILTMNARSLLNFFRLRCCNRAQWEINKLACSMFKLVYAVAPAIFKNGGPSCLSGKCSEGKMTCGEAEMVKKKFEKLKENK